MVTGGMHTGGKHTGKKTHGKKHIRLLAHQDTCTLGYLHIRRFAHSVTCTLGALHTELCTLPREKKQIMAGGELGEDFFWALLSKNESLVSVS